MSPAFGKMAMIAPANLQMQAFPVAEKGKTARQKDTA
jgi:hypothetical protein